jgi:ribosomal protein S18 acetylase RimI-like enzyme
MSQENLRNENKESAVIIRKATPADFRGFREVHYQSWLGTYINSQIGITREDIEKKFEDRFSIERFEKYKAMLEETDRFILVAVSADKIIGFVDFYRNPSYNELKAIYVHPDFIGKKVGIMLWEGGKSFINSSLPTKLEVASYNQRAIDFYHKLGFMMTDKTPTVSLTMPVSGTVMPVRVMELKPSSS